MITRFSVLPDDRRVLLGTDKAEIFEAGVVYEAVKIMDEIVFRPIGKHALPESKADVSAMSTVDRILETGLHLLTEKEAEEYFNK